MAVKSGIHIGGITFPFGTKLKLKEIIYSFLKGFLEFYNISTRNIMVMELNSTGKIPAEADIETVNFIKHERDVQKIL